MTSDPRHSLWTRKPFWSRLAVWILAPAGVIVAFLVLLLRGSLPITQGELGVKGLGAELHIARDLHSVPEIRARTDNDALFGLGFVHAQDRLWQMEMDRRLASGRLSEVLGERALRVDRATRRIGLVSNARRILDHLEDADRRLLSAYVDGVNAGMRALSSWPIEFQLLRHVPEPWKPEDSLLLMQWMAWQFSGNANAEIERMLLIQNHGREVAQALAPGVPADIDALLAQAISQPGMDGAGQEQAADGLARLAHAGRQAGIFNDADRLTGSNGWVVSGRHTASRLPLLANDPHLTNPLPGIWYLADLRGDRLHVSGATMPGLPFVLIGRNEHIAWGMTNAKADTQDVVLEEINPLDRNQYRLGNRFVDMELSRETITVRPGMLRPARSPEVIEVRRSVHGPLVSDIAGSLGSLAYSIRWTGDDDRGGTFRSFMALGYAQDWQSFNAALSTFVTPIHVFLYADVKGHIGLVAPGKYPVRVRGDGSLPVSGRVNAEVWRSFLPYDAVPRIADPASGFLVAANQPLPAAGDPRAMGADYAPPYRAQRIQAELERSIKTRTAGLTATDMAAIQQDILAPIVGSGVLTAMRSLKPADEREQRVLALLSGWNGSMEVDSPAASLVVSWTAHLNDLMLSKLRGAASRGGASHDPLDALRHEDNAEFLQRLLTDPTNRWCGVYVGAPGASCERLLRDALERAINELSALLGDDASAWRWGQLHKLRLAHFPFSRPRFQPYLPAIEELPLGPVFDREIEVGGGNETVNFGSTSFSRNSRYLQFYGPQYRQVVDLGAGAPAWFIQATGQSGNPLSTHYDDLVDLHLRGHYLNMGGRAPATLLVLRPSAH